MTRNLQLAVLAIAVGGLIGLPTGAIAEPQPAVPAEFDYIGTYRLVKRVKVRSDKLLPVMIRPLDFRVYTDGITIRLYGSGESAGYTSFTIYRNDGIVHRHSDAEVETVPGLQAHSLVGHVNRQLCLTEETLKLHKVPAFSDVVEITYGRRLMELPAPTETIAVQFEEE